MLPLSTHTPSHNERVKKSIRFTSHTHHAIEQTAKNLKLNFSQTVEVLVKLGLQDTSTLAAAELHRAAADQGVSRALNRYLKLVSQVVIAANEAKEMAQQAFFVQLCDLSQRIGDPDEIDYALTLDPSNELDKALIDLYEERKERGRNRAVRQLKRAINIDDDLWQQITLWGRDERQPPIH